MYIKGWMDFLYDTSKGSYSIEKNKHNINLKEDIRLGKIYEKLYV